MGRTGSETVLKGNKGEWSEIYAFCYLLNSGVLQAADKDLNPSEDIYFPILKILREEERGAVLDYFPTTAETTCVRIYKGDELKGEVPKEDISDSLQALLTAIPQGERAFSIPGLDGFFDNLFITKLKADSSHKEDIEMQIHDINTGISPVCGFSIKSYLGSSPTLVNAGQGTNFIYEIEGCNKSIEQKVNSIETKTKIIDRIKYLSEAGCKILSKGEMQSPQFRENLEFVDSMMPEIASEAVLASYSSGIKTLSDISAILEQSNPIGFSNAKMYPYKIKKFLCACALGMTPEKHWEGEEDANGGYIVVKKDGSVVCYHLYNRADFEQYLFEYTRFESPSTSRYGYMSVFEEAGKYKIKLNMQVRFK